jgi:hypothetical protein
MTTGALADRAAVRFDNPTTGEVLLVFPVDSPEPCPQCGQRRCVFLERRAAPALCLICSNTRGERRVVVDAGGGALVGVPWNEGHTFTNDNHERNPR